MPAALNPFLAVREEIIRAEISRLYAEADAKADEIRRQAWIARQALKDAAIAEALAAAPEARPEIMHKLTMAKAEIIDKRDQDIRQARFPYTEQIKQLCSELDAMLYSKRLTSNC